VKLAIIKRRKHIRYVRGRKNLEFIEKTVGITS
jgi:hypothetical protein